MTTAKTLNPALLDVLAKEAHAISRDHGFWENPPSVERSVNLMHSEVSELLEDLRDGKAITLFEFLPPAEGQTPSGETGDPSAARSGKPVGPVSELADVVIRLLDFAGAHGLSLHGNVDFSTFAKNGDVDGWISDMHKSLTRIVAEHHDFPVSLDLARVPAMREAWRARMAKPVFTSICIVFACAEAHGIDLLDAIRVKMAFNKSRPRKHGKAF